MAGLARHLGAGLGRERRNGPRRRFARGTAGIVLCAALFFPFAESKALRLQPCTQMGNKPKSRLGRNPRGQQKRLAQQPVKLASKAELEAERAAAAMVEMCFPSPPPAPPPEPAWSSPR